MAHTRFHEALDPRRLLAADAPFVLMPDGTLAVTGTPAGDVIRVELDPHGGTLTARLNGLSATYASSDVLALSLRGLGGDDQITNATGLRATLEGGDGADTLRPGGGRDTVLGGNGPDVMFWSPDNDAYGGGEFLGDHYDDGSVDLVDLSAAPGRISLRQAIFAHATSHPVPFGLNVPAYIGTFDFHDNGADPIDGERDFLNSYDIDAIRLGRFDDSLEFDFTFPSFYANRFVTIYGGAGNDFFMAGANAITAYGEEGDDWFSHDFYANGAINSYGGPGDDVLAVDPALFDFNMGPGRNALIFHDTYVNPVRLRNGIWDVYNVVVGLGDTEPELPFEIIGNDLPNLITSARWGGTRGVQTDLPLLIRGEGGDDTIVSNGGDDTILGGDGNDLIIGVSGNDRLFGGDGNDTLFGGLGDDALFGEGGNDLLVSGGGRDTLDGGAGRNKLIFTGPRIRDDLFGAPETLELAAVVTDRR
jgi:Ca2+-binding RTX toxin-like protein